MLLIMCKEVMNFRVFVVNINNIVIFYVGCNKFRLLERFNLNAKELIQEEYKNTVKTSLLYHMVAHCVWSNLHNNFEDNSLELYHKILCLMVAIINK